MRLYKYMPTAYVDGLVKEGRVLFRSLAYFRQYEDQRAIGDRLDGTRTFRPHEGLTITKSAGESFTVPWSFDATGNVLEVFVFCTSTVLDHRLAQEFKADACVTIRAVPEFAAKLRGALPVRPAGPNVLIHGAVSYYAGTDPPNPDWALPDRIIMSKLQMYRYQSEYRFAFGPPEAFRFEGANLQLVVKRALAPATRGDHPQQVVALGDISDICSVRTWPAA